jgi:two-component system sensor histidine kinase HydH
VTRDTAGDPAETGLRKSQLIRELVDLSRFTEGILRTMGSAVVAVSPGGRIRYVNPAASRLFERPAGDLLGARAAEVLRTRGGGDLVEFAADNPAATGEIDLEPAPGRTVTMEVRLSPYDEEEDGEPGGFVAILTDLTDVKTAEAHARRREQLASLGELSAGVAHEIRNPLAGIAASAQLLEKRAADDERLAPLVTVILDETRRLERIVGSLLEFARPADPRLQRTDVVASIDRALALVESQAADKGVELARRVAADIPEIWIDADLIQQVALNVVQNALQAVDEGGTVTVSVEVVRKPPYVRRSRGRRAGDRSLPPPEQPALMDWVEIAVADTGHGIDPDTLRRVFDPFYTTRSQGTGLGLAISQAIVQEHSGRITVESEPGEGTVVRVDLPVERRQGQRRRRGE